MYKARHLRTTREYDNRFPSVLTSSRVGRQDGNTIRLTERNVSRQHARLVRNAQQGYRIEDLDSYNGVVVNGAKIDKAVDLRDGDRVGVGDYIIALKSEADAPPPVPPQPARSALPAGGSGSPPARFVMVSAPAPGASFPRQPLVRIGRLEDSPVHRHRAISREHARVCTRQRVRESRPGSANACASRHTQAPRLLFRRPRRAGAGALPLRVGSGETTLRPVRTRSRSASSAVSSGPRSDR